MSTITETTVMPAQLEALLSLEEAAAVLRTSPRQLASLAKRNEIAAAKSGRQWVFRPSFLDEYIDRQTQPAKWIARSHFEPSGDEGEPADTSHRNVPAPETAPDPKSALPTEDWGRRRRGAA